MATTYVYKAKKNASETVTGKINARSEDEAIDLINQLGFLPVSIVPEAVTEKEQKAASTVKKIKIKELYIFSRQLANLLKSGLPLLRALGIIGKQTSHPYFKTVISTITDEVKNGKSFSASLEMFPHVFSSLFTTMVKAGEESGNLQQMLVNVSLHQKQQDEILTKVRHALAYPMLMGVVGVGTIYFILTFVLPKLSGLFSSLGESLPLPTIILLNVSTILSEGWIWFLIVGCAAVFFFKRWVQSESGRWAMSRFSLKIPLFGELMLKAELGRFTRTLVLLHKGGVSLINALQITIPILKNEVIKAQLIKCNEDLTSGGSFGESIQQFKEIPLMMGHLITVGEESGNLDEVLEDISETYEQEINEMIKVMTTLIEPIMILAIGAVIGLIVFAMLLPIFQIDILSQ